MVNNGMMVLNILMMIFVALMTSANKIPDFYLVRDLDDTESYRRVTASSLCKSTLDESAAFN